ncbi:hypothetical protein EKE94_14970 [Mesobaculum littorinae]|uniref:Uncharacterized protein n=1 Tax=Mesobaculum littorinae TaxID=2486419 RepID=A0A438AF22_9RHOB|nr:hypothetical protein [Mesobaculum littorinae]RVV97311.1 hypothetical protein EKE94_14970 [Mesobaculum littorinae]
MKHFPLAAALMTAVTSAAAAQDRDANALAYFQTYCLGTEGDLAQSIASLEASDQFQDQSSRGSGAFTYSSFAGPDGTNASVMIGAEMSDDKCSIILTGVTDPMALASRLGGELADGAGAPVMEWEGFGDYGNGGFGYRDELGDVVIAPMTTGISGDILHLTFFPT